MKKIMISGISILAGCLLGIGICANLFGDKIKRQRELSDKHFALYYLMIKWVYIKQDGKCLSEYFVRHGYKRVAIYGMNYIGDLLLNELKGVDVEVEYGIDKNAADIEYESIQVVTPDDQLDEVDVIVVTSVTFFDSIEEILKKKVSCPIVSVEDILYECKDERITC